MKTYFLFIIFFVTMFNVSSINAQNREPTFQLNHVDISIDSISLIQIMNNDFIRDSFAFIKVFKDSTGTEVLLLGKESFVHLLPDKGFFKNRIGACLLVHHSFQWKETDTLKQYLQTFTRDSLYNRPYTSKELSIDYINVYEKSDEEGKLLKFIPILQNHSKKDYQSWGYSQSDFLKGISQKKYMYDYIGKDVSKKLFNNIVNISVMISKNELERIQFLLNAYGYKRFGNSYKLYGNPTINVMEMKSNMRTISLTILLSESVKSKTISISPNATLQLNKNKAIFCYQISNNYR